MVLEGCVVFGLTTTRRPGLIAWMPMRLVAVLPLVGCHGGAAGPPTVATLRTACSDAEIWTWTACAPRGDAPTKIEAGKKAIAALKIADATKQLDDAEKSGPLDHDSNITLWEQ